MLEVHATNLYWGCTWMQVFLKISSQPETQTTAKNSTMIRIQSLFTLHQITKDWEIVLLQFLLSLLSQQHHIYLHPVNIHVFTAEDEQLFIIWWFFRVIAYKPTSKTHLINNPSRKLPDTRSTEWPTFLLNYKHL